MRGDLELDVRISSSGPSRSRPRQGSVMCDTPVSTNASHRRLIGRIGRILDGHGSDDTTHLLPPCQKQLIECFEQVRSGFPARRQLNGVGLNARPTGITRSNPFVVGRAFQPDVS